MRTIVVILTACLMASGTRAASERQSAQDKPEEAKVAKGQATSVVAQSAGEDPAYRIGPQDVLKIDVWKEEQLSRTVPVRPDGKITLPLLNDVQAVGLTPMELARVISDQLKKYINEPQVTVSVTEINSRRIYVNGEVTKAGAYALLPHMTVLQALSSSGGFTQFARVKNIYVLRMENSKQTKIPFNYKEAISGKNATQNIELQPGDVIVVP
ncbi:MAG TPA: polysaccharide biosynthesis/export family protein [Candidatus Acidoferrum sp.]